ncbi:sulfite exporter TauE/SafE family protein [Halomicroarcula limicola]|uniref:Probable membrane transporter protein n=1 Tax=Haloarcula limicola TaxID=1429915 RepID=A0A8J8C8P7_9EURY|nr:sulfite exporter TauE/SafE family protein [Halomicroarcula limicola]MBV0926293.1 sulfite exporter TauE/SafE family protein [Halomicroarcula limicola]
MAAPLAGVSNFSPQTIAYGLAVLLLGGFVKGTVGFAVGLVVVAGLVQVFPAKEVTIILSVPFLLSNVIVLKEEGVPSRFLRQQVPFIGALFVGLVLGVILLSIISSQVLYLLLAAYIALFLAISQDKLVAYAEKTGLSVGSGLFAGLLGGVIGVPGPPLVVHTYIQVAEENTEFVAGVSSLFLVAHLLRIGILASDRLLGVRGLVIGVLLTIPIWIGVVLGVRFRDYIPDRRFEQTIKVFLAIIGVRLLMNGLSL